jgi:ferredoxin
MATVITEECINCGACEPECPNTAIYQGGVEWELDGVTHPAISDSIFYIVPEKCTECVGFYDHEACAAVCPVDCCVPDPKIPETEAVLLERAKKLHPDQDFGPDFPSRFKEKAAAPEPEPAPASAAAPVAAAAAAPKVAAAAPTGRVERPKAPPPKPIKQKNFPGELGDDFDALVAEYRVKPSGRTPLVIRLIVLALSPVLGALPHGTKDSLEKAIGDRRFFSNSLATGLNVLHNMILYPILLSAFGYFALGHQVFSSQMKWMVALGLTIGTFEAAWRMREAFLRARAIDETPLGPALYGLPLVPLVAPFARGAAKKVQQVGAVGFDGFYGGNFDEKMERDRRYGDVYRLEDWGRAYFLRLEFPRVLPPTGLKWELGLGDDMPDYDYDVALANGSVVVRGRVVDDRVKKLTAVGPAFPPEFTKQLDLGNPVRGFRHRYRDKILEVVLPKKD